ncbi:glycoside hydrolase [Collybia nuda]|uniref:Glycoside hydrolase n=1 Tax=Collybia nuda TaxID=64659 RepID=A0A9P6C9U5_9AGAR|nr:glycoside hydrolase [Collybia nuda]
MCGLVPPKQVSRGVVNPASFNAAEDVLATAWYPGWLADVYPPEKISWTKFNAMTFAFGLTTNDVSKVDLAGAEQALQTFVTQAKNNSVPALLSIGGWTGSQYFSTAVATEANRTAFVQTILGLVSTYNLDGIDFDWEYPNKQGLGCNTISPSDSANFLLFLQALRATPVGSNITLSAAVGLAPFNGPDEQPMSDVSGFAKVLDYIAIMAYDIWGSFSTGGVGPNAPLDDSCAPSKQGSATAAVKAWTAAKFPPHQIALGVAAYGHSFHVDTSSAKDSSGNLIPYPPFNKAQQPLGDGETTSNTQEMDKCGVVSGPGGVFSFWSLINNKFLNADGTPASGIDYRFDNCGQTPYVYNPTSQVMVSFDDPKSFAAKGQFIDTQGLRGFAMWHAAGDADDLLIDSISDAMGIEQVCS